MLSDEQTVATTCPFCGVGCRLDLHTQGNQILAAMMVELAQSLQAA